MNCALSRRSTQSLFLNASGKWAALHSVCPFSFWPPWKQVTVHFQAKNTSDITSFLEQTWHDYGCPCRWWLPQGNGHLLWGITQETPGCIACDTLSEQVWMLICCNDTITADTDLVVALYLQCRSWYDALADAAYVQIFSEDGVTTNNWTSTLVCTIWGHKTSCHIWLMVFMLLDIAGCLQLASAVVEYVLEI